MSKEVVKMQKPKSLRTAKFVLGIWVENQDVVEVPKGAVKDFLKLGFKIVEEKEPEVKETKAEAEEKEPEVKSKKGKKGNK